MMGRDGGKKRVVISNVEGPRQIELDKKLYWETARHHRARMDVPGPKGWAFQEAVGVLPECVICSILRGLWSKWLVTEMLTTRDACSIFINHSPSFLSGFWLFDFCTFSDH